VPFLNTLDATHPSIWFDSTLHNAGPWPRRSLRMVCHALHNMERLGCNSQKESGQHSIICTRKSMQTTCLCRLRPTNKEQIKLDIYQVDMYWISIKLICVGYLSSWYVLDIYQVDMCWISINLI
jgi:hypothetical protein